jgi:hypothetical protein
VCGEKKTINVEPCFGVGFDSSHPKNPKQDLLYGAILGVGSFKPIVNIN